MDDLILTFSVEEGSIELNQGIIEVLGRPKQVQIRIDDSTCQLMLRACNLEEEQAIVVQQEEAPQIGGRRLMKQIRALTGWKGEASRSVYGVYLPGFDAVIFNLKDARTVDDCPVNDCRVNDCPINGSPVSDGANNGRPLSDFSVNSQTVNGRTVRDRTDSEGRMLLNS